MLRCYSIGIYFNEWVIWNNYNLCSLLVSLVDRLSLSFSQLYMQGEGEPRMESCPSMALLAVVWYDYYYASTPHLLSYGTLQGARGCMTTFIPNKGHGEGEPGNETRFWFWTTSMYIIWHSGHIRLCTVAKQIVKAWSKDTLYLQTAIQYNSILFAMST